MKDLSSWSLKEKIGQLLICGFDGYEPTEGISELIKDYKLGGIIYFRRNIGTHQEVAALSAKLRSIAAEASDVPLTISIDQEGGMVSRIDGDIALMPGNMTVGATGSADYAYESARVSGVELRAMGINMNFAPCLDVNNNGSNPVIGVRSFGESPSLVAKLGRAAVEGYQAAGVSPCAKHFPGHGDTTADSHYEMPIVAHDGKRLDRVELVPFREAIKAEVDLIMTAHVMFPAYEPDGLPATLSSKVLTGLLREELGYDGIIITDCLEMNAISAGVGVAKGAVMALQAGADIVLVSHRLDRQKAAFDAIHAAVLSGELSEARIDASVERILRMKEKRKVEVSEASNASEWIACEAHLAVAREICEHAVTIVKNENGALPLRKNESALVIWPEVRENTEVIEVIEQELTLGKALAAYIGNVKEVVVGMEPTESEIAMALEESNGYSQIIVGTYNGSFSSGQTRLVQALLERNKTAPEHNRAAITVAMLRNPYDLQAFPEVDACIACYENRPAMLEAAAKAASGELIPSGVLPVTLALN